jgi:undecaprenyl diphosphate synthase
MTPQRPIRHVAIIMDGNGRWAARRGLTRGEGHKAGLEAARRTVRAAKELGIPILTLYAFSAENYGRPLREVELIFRLLDGFLEKEAKDLANDGIRLRVIGDRTRLPRHTRQLIEEAERLTRFGRAMTLCLAVGYGARGEIAAACKAIAEKVEAGELDAAAIDADVVGKHLMTRELPDPDLLIRTAKEVRLSNFLLWQLAYAEMVFLDLCWPDFSPRDLAAAVSEFGLRRRTYGLVSP